ncbi:insulinase family protein [Desulfuromonas sp. AOP6]|uniref:insulinase family protein n=1 Tax=Desulfuromonas sp. AOP6 TaxID=1566351 RepID=UPI001278EAF4|nr:insulinase family protein [Desulfuromonas sp. AOP6]BCA79319.1 metalloprotease [Desulfuromonas sp. AOP6]
MSDHSLQPGQKLHGFTLIDMTPLPELNARLIQLRHDRTGARMVHMETEDDNNLFGVGFHTTPMDSTGVAHILEHTVLCGSRNFPVRDPFFSMLKRSLNTFMNALTSSDWTLYPFASQNEKDFYNLMAIYLDAAFFPRLLERDFRQEGHRLEFQEADNPESPLEYKGVVYNEMKGAMADPSSLSHRRLSGALYPTTTYGKNSGGEPSDIPNLTWEELREFHATYYHPANAYFFTYGHLPLEKHLETIENLALRHFDAKALDTAVPDEMRFEQPRKLTETYPADPAEPLENRTLVQTAWLTCPAADNFNRVALQVLSTLLLGNSAAPLYKALIESKLGQNLSPVTGYHDDNRETFFAVGLQGTEPEHTDKIEALILETLQEAADKGFPEERVEAAIHQLEFAHREVTGDQYPYALLLLMRLLGPWIHSGDPVTPLLLTRDLERLRAEVAAGPFFQNLIRRYLLDNSHRVTLTLTPDPERKVREDKEVADNLQALAARLTPGQKQQIVEQARELQEAQEMEEDLSVLPTLELSDIPAEERSVHSREEKVEGVELTWFDQPTNGIVYFSAQTEGSHIPADLRPFVPLFCALLPQIGAAGLSYLEMAERMSAATGGIRASASILENPQAMDSPRMVISVRGKALRRNQEKMFAILTDLFNAPDFSDLTRLHTVINQIKTSMENSIPGSGHTYAARLAASQLTEGGKLREEWTGISQVRFVKKIAAKTPAELADLAEKMRALAGLLLGNDGMRCALTAEAETFEAIRPAVAGFLKSLSKTPATPAARAPFTPVSARKGCAAAVPVSYVAQIFRTGTYTQADAAPLMVLAKLLRANFLHREIREKGGAYGGLAGADPEAGLFSMLSYRDPQLTRTLKVYEQAVDWAIAGKYSDEEIKEAILASFSDLDRPLSPGGKASREFNHQLQGLTLAMRQTFRQRLLAVNREALQRAADTYLKQGWQDSSVAVVSGEEQLQKANAELGEAAFPIERI